MDSPHKIATKKKHWFILLIHNYRCCYILQPINTEKLDFFLLNEAFASLGSKEKLTPLQSTRKLCPPGKETSTTVLET